MDTDPLQDRLFHEHGVEVPILPWPRPPRRLVRVSTHVYTGEAEIARLAAALPALLAAEKGSDPFSGRKGV
jgi:isopenicillin-N epimerase